MIAYHTKFILNLASILSPLYLLLRKGKPWKWGEAETATFWEGQEHTHINFSPGLRRISIWDWCSPLPFTRRWNAAQANCFCKPHLGSSRKKLFPVEERRSGTCVWSEAIQPVSLRQAIYYHIRPQTTERRLSQFAAASSMAAARIQKWILPTECSISQVPLFPMQTASSRFSKGGPRSWGDTAD